MTINDELRAMRERVEAATEGPWEVDHNDFRQVQRDGDGEWIASVRTYRRGNAKADSGFIAHARADLPKLLDAVERVMAIKSPPKPPEWDFEGLQEWAGRVDALALIRATITEALDA